MAADSTAVNGACRTRDAAGLKACVTAALAAILLSSAGVTGAPYAHQAPSRIISLVPAATEMLFAVGVGPNVVAVGSYDDYPPETAKLPRVGALLDPDVERILSLRPDFVVVFATQTDLGRQLRKAGITVFEYKQAGLADVMQTIRALGSQVGHADDAARVAHGIEQRLDNIRRAVAGLPRPKTLIVFGRERLALRGIYASGGVGFIHDMLIAAGGANTFADVKQQAVQASTESIIARRPEVIIELHSPHTPMAHGAIEDEIRTWSILASVPAVRSHHVYYLVDDRLVVPGPRVAEGVRILADVLHPGAMK